MKINQKAKDYRTMEDARLAGGFGAAAAKQKAEALLRRSVLACLLWEDLFYEDGVLVVKNIQTLVPQVEPQAVFDLAVEARTKQMLRHVPLLLAREMARYPEHKKLVGELLPTIIQRADEIAEFMALYWKDGKQPLSKQVKVGLAAAFGNFTAYGFAKYNRDTEIKLRDVMFLVHPDPIDLFSSPRTVPMIGEDREELYRQIAENSLPAPDTWEVALSAGADKRASWSRLLVEKKLGTLAFLRNLRNMDEAGVDPALIRSYFNTLPTRFLLPVNCWMAAQTNPLWMGEIETLMLTSLGKAPELPGHTVLVIDVSGSMSHEISSRSRLARLDVAGLLAVLAREVCESVRIYATAGNDSRRMHTTDLLPPYRGFALVNAVKRAADIMGGGGIFTRQCLEFIKGRERETPERIIIFSDSQDCDLPERRLPAPFGRHNYIVDVSAHAHGVNYQGLWTAELSGWSDHFLTFIAALEGNTAAGMQEDEQ